MAQVRRLDTTEALQGANWVVVERRVGGGFRACGLSSAEDTSFGPFPYKNERDAIGAAQTWAFHNDVSVIYVREPA